jgi:hypothetical protein
MLERKWGRLLFVSSVAAFTGGVVGAHYAASKAGLHGLMHHLAPRVAADGVTVNWLMGQENLDPPWTFGPAGERYEMSARGNPAFTVVIKGFQPESVAEGLKSNNGIVATAAHCVNSVPAVCGAAPGIATYLDLPLISGKAATHLR